MGKRKIQSEERRKRFKSEADAALSTGVFGGDTKQTSIDDVENDDWIEQSYHSKLNTQEEVVEGLPIKRLDGKVERITRKAVADKEDEHQDEEPEKQTPKETEPQDHDIATEFEESLTPKQRLVAMKEEIADLASKLMEDPEENVTCLTRLRKMSMSKNVVLSQLSIMALIPVFKSLAPGYKIRQLSDTEKRERVSREVARLRTFEQSLISNYKMYVDYLYKLSKVTRSNSENNKKVDETQVKMGQLALKACCELLESSLNSFNYRDELLSIIIKRLNKKPQNIDDFHIFTKCVRVLESLLMDDKEHGELSLDLVKILVKSVTTKNFRVDESVLNILLSLSILDDYTPPNLKYDSQTANKFKVNKKDRVHLSKKQKKARKELKEIELELEKAKQTITAEEREKFQSKLLQTTLKLYLEILKARDSNKDANGLMASVLEGLSKFGKMANFDLLGDFLEVLREIMFDTIDEVADEDDEDNTGLYDSKQVRSILLCIVTSFQLTLNHMELTKLNVDLSGFTSSLYRMLADISLDCDLEFGSKSLRLMDPLTQKLDKPAVNVSTKSELLLHCLDSIFFRNKNSGRVISFVKRLYISILHTPEKTSLASLKFIGKLMNKYGQAASLYNTEDRSGDGTYVLGTEIDRPVEQERCNADAATLWENVLLDKHYCPMVRDGARSLMKSSKSQR